MPNELPDPFSAVRQFGEQAAQGVKTMTDGASQAASQALTALSTPLRTMQLPGLPGLTQGNTRPAAAPDFLAPLAAPLQVVSQLEEVALPNGAPRPAAQLLQTVRNGMAPTQRGRTEEQPPPPAPRVRRQGRGQL